MNTQKYISLLAQPQQISKEDLSNLGSIITKYPFFQSARALQLKGLKNENSFLYNEALKKTAAYTTDRDVLFDYITSDVFLQNEISEQILQNSEAIKRMEVISENISEKISAEIDQQLKAEIKKAEAILHPKLFERKEEKKEAENTLNVNEPLSFHKNETHSFSEWLKLTKATPIDRSEDENTFASENANQDVARKFELIERFIQEKKRPVASLEDSKKDSQEKNINLADPYTKPSESFMTETL
ncbi:MAG: hypothetical protein KDC91_06755, partial [Flavobacteriaceae bacterium]|nr:hypothetical protein [Flavobacteriaceae bacterium]